jgi:MOSC domain-containing protein YiiM
MKLLAVSVGLPQKVTWQGKEVLTSIFKSPVEGAVAVRKDNIEGDRQADLRVHGGTDKAVYAYSYDAYPWWQKELGLDALAFGALGENLTIDHLDETNIFVGDVFEVGSCQIEAVQPRIPCFKLEIKFSTPKMVEAFYRSNRCGVYFRVITEGSIQAGDSPRLIKSEPTKGSIIELFQFAKDKNSISKSRAEALAKIPSLNEKWRQKLEQR